jgi:hypothetical protein
MFVLDFFEKDKECKLELIELKNQYFKDLEQISPASCKNCERKKLRDKYLDILLNGNYGF